MPKVEILHSETTQVPTELKEILQKHFPEVLIRKLERLGGRIVISVTSPFDKDKKKKSEIVIDENFVKDLNFLLPRTSEIQNELSKLSVRQLRQLAKLMKQPLRSNATSLEIRSELLGNLTSEEFWKKITK